MMHLLSQPQQRRSVLLIVSVLVFVVGAGGVALYLLAQSSAGETETNTFEPETFQNDVLLFPSTVAAPWEDTSATIQSTTPSPEPVSVYISGAVLYPDVYTLPGDARVKDAVMAAGGLTADADWEYINLAAYIFDTQHIYIPRVEERDYEEKSSGSTDNTAHQTTETGININTATSADLQKIQGIGAVLAQRIVEYRTTNGPFESVDDLQNVRGISLTFVDDIRPYITVGK